MFLVPSVTSVIGMKYLYVDRAKNQFFKNAPISTPGVSNESSFKSGLTNTKSGTPQGPSTGRKSGLNPKNTTYSVTYSKG